jgi:signal transduction histidine kinase
MQLEAHPFFQNFDPAVAHSLRRFATTVELPAGEFLFHEGAPADALYLVLQGEIELVKEFQDRLEPLARSREGDYFGELAVLDGSGRASGARAACATVLSRIPGEPFVDALRGAPGRVALGILRKVTDNLRSTNERFMSVKLAQEKLGLIGEMAGTIVHDLKGPYTGIRLAVEDIRELHAQHAPTVELCRLVEEQVRRSLSMIEDLLQYARGVTQVDRRPVLLSELVAKFEQLNRAYVGAAGARIDTDVAPEPALVDEDKLLRALTNLVNNSVECFEGRPGSIRIEGRREGDHLLLLVHDDGPGIPGKIRDRVFEPFVTFGKPNGTGLGLPIARSIVEAHGGGIAFQTAMGKGTTFTITLPAPPASGG